MSQKTHSQDSNCKGNCKCSCITVEESLQMYRDAALADNYLFGDYDYSEEWLNNIKEDSEGE